MNKTSLKQFLIESNRAGYASGDERGWTKETDGSTTIRYTSGEWKFHDNFFGGEPYGGRLLVFRENKPYWIMVYYGWVTEGTATDPVYAVLRNALMQMPEDAPFRGPKEFKQDDYIYVNTWTGDIEKYSGEEQVKLKNKIVYRANYMGGLVDVRGGV